MNQTVSYETFRNATIHGQSEQLQRVTLIYIKTLIYIYINPEKNTTHVHVTAGANSLVTSSKDIVCTYRPKLICKLSQWFDVV